MTDQQKKEDRAAMSRKSHEFLNSVSTLAHTLELPHALVLYLFGAIARRIVEQEIKDGDQRADATMRALDFFTRGMGIDTMLKQVDGDEAEQIRAEFEAAADDKPLQ